MNRDNLEGAARSAFGQGERLAGDLLKDKQTSAHGRYDEVVGKAQSAVGSAKDAVASGVDAASSIDLTGIRDEIAKLTQTVTDLVQKQASTTRDQVMGAVEVASDNLSQSASAAQDTLDFDGGRGRNPHPEEPLERGRCRRSCRRVDRQNELSIIAHREIAIWRTGQSRRRRLS